MAIDFTLTAQQRELQLASRKFAKEVLAEARRAELLGTPEERFLATKPTYEAMVTAGFEPLPTEWWHFDGPGWERYELLDRTLTE